MEQCGGKDGGKDGAEKTVFKGEEREGMGVCVDGGKGSRGNKNFLRLYTVLYNLKCK